MANAAVMLSSTGLIGMLIQVAPLPAELGWVQHVTTLGSGTLLAVGVVVLWKELKAQKAAAESREALLLKRLDDKDDKLMGVYKAGADTFASNQLTLERMAHTLEQMSEAVQDLRSVRSMFAGHEPKHSGGD